MKPTETPGLDLALAGQVQFLSAPTLDAAGATTLRMAIEDAPLAAFLLARPDPAHPRSRHVDLLRAWCLAAALASCARAEAAPPQRGPTTDRDSSIHVGLRAVRLICTAPRWAGLWPELPDIPRDHAELLAILDDWAVQMHRRRATYFHNRANEISGLCRLLVRTRDRRSGGGRGGPREPEFGPWCWPVAALPVAPSETLGGQRRQVLVYHAPPSDLALEDAPLDAEEAADIAAVSGYAIDLAADPAFGAGDDDRSLEADCDLIDVLDQGQGWCGDAAALDDADCHHLWQRIERALAEPEPVPGAIWCGLSLALGRDIPELVASLAARPAPGSSWRVPAGLAFAPDVTGATGATIHRNGLVMHLPLRLAAALRIAEPCDVDTAIAAAQGWLRQALPGRLPRLSRLARALADGLAAVGEDAAVIGLLSGRRVEQMVQLYYASVRIERLDAAWRRHLRERLGCRDAAAGVFGLGTCHRVGSLRAPAVAEVGAYFQQLADQVIRARGVAERDIYRVADLHAAVTSHVGAVLAMVGALRPHGLAYPPLGGIVGQHRPRLRVIDKGSRMVSDARWIPLPPVARRAIGLWRRKTEALIDPGHGIGLLNPAFAQRARAALDGVAPPLIGLTSIFAAPTDLRAAELWEAAGTPAEAPRNWTRHFLRRELMEAGLSGALIDGFMGHGGAPSDPLRPTSGASIQDGDALAGALEAICAPLACIPQMEIP